jgi:hypothetical protein
MADEAKKLPDSINFDYLKSSQFRVIHADGAFLALTGQGGITISFFAERQPIPRRVVHKVNTDGSIGAELTEARVVRDAIIRDTEAAITMSLDTAVRVHNALSDMIKKSQQAAEQSKQIKREGTYQ